MSRISSFTDTTGFRSPQSSAAWAGCAGAGGLDGEHAIADRTTANEPAHTETRIGQTSDIRLPGSTHAESAAGARLLLSQNPETRDVQRGGRNQRGGGSTC